MNTIRIRRLVTNLSRAIILYIKKKIARHNAKEEAECQAQDIIASCRKWEGD